MISELRTGLITSADGAVNPARSDRSGALVIASAHGDFYEAASRGHIFAVSNQAGITTQAGLSATTPALTLYNPPGSGVNANLIFAGATFSVAFAAASVVWVAVNTDLTAAQTTGTATTAHRCTLLGNERQPRIRPLLAATLPAAPVAIATLGVGLTGGITTVPQMLQMGQWYHGSIVIAPGGALSIQTSTASGTTATFCDYIWEEVDIA